MIKERDSSISELKSDIRELKATYDTRLEIANREITILKDNLCAVKKVKSVDNKGVEAVKKALVELQKEAEVLRKRNKVLMVENAELKKFMDEKANAKHFR